MHAHTEGPVQFPCRRGEGAEGKEDREENGRGDTEGLRCQEHSNQCHTATERTPTPPPETKGDHPRKP